MTAEIALLNRSAVALAADSAVTISYWLNGERHTRYSKSANKIFHISHSRPVGLMIYQADTLQGMPWEVIAKAYRTARGAEQFATLDEYADDLFRFIEADLNMFPADKQKEQLFKNIAQSATNICSDILSRLPEKKIPDAEKIALVAQTLDEFISLLASDNFIDSVDFPTLSEAIDKSRQNIIDGFDGYTAFDTVKPFIDVNKLYKLALNLTFRKMSGALPDTGVVIAGYGESEYFPRLLRFRCYGVLQGQLIYDKLFTQNVSISHSIVSEIQPIAQSNMVDTFIHGASMAALKKMENLFVESIGECLSAISTDGSSPLSPEEIEQRQNDAANQFTTGLVDYLWTEHTLPLRKVIGTLSIAELAELADTLISIESLKERVTRPTESVSGPIDVAVISKTDGFIWIRRKHYFHKDLNPRYFNNHRS